MLWSSLELLIRRQLLIVSITCLLLLWSGGFCSAKINYSVKYGSRAMSHIPFLVFEDVLFSKTSQTFLVFEDVFKTSSRRLQRNTFRLPWRLPDVLQLCLQDVLKDKKMLHWRRLQDVFCTSSLRRMFAGIEAIQKNSILSWKRSNPTQSCILKCDSNMEYRI